MCNVLALAGDETYCGQGPAIDCFGAAGAVAVQRAAVSYLRYWQEYARAHCCIIDAIAGDEPLQQVSWYACTPAGNDSAMIALACILGEGCLSMRFNDDGSFYGDAFLMSPMQAAGHICIELSDHVLQNVIFLACTSRIMQVCCDV